MQPHNLALHTDIGDTPCGKAQYEAAFLDVPKPQCLPDGSFSPQQCDSRRYYIVSDSVVQMLRLPNSNHIFASIHIKMIDCSMNHAH